MSIIEEEGFAMVNGKNKANETLPMTYSDSFRIRNQYINHSAALKLPDNRVFKGIKFSVQEIEQIIGEGTNKASEIYIALGFHNGVPKSEFRGATMIAHAVDAANNIIKDTSRIYDYSLACPDNCPNE